MWISCKIRGAFHWGLSCFKNKVQELINQKFICFAPTTTIKDKCEYKGSPLRVLILPLVIQLTTQYQGLQFTNVGYLLLTQGHLLSLLFHLNMLTLRHPICHLGVQYDHISTQMINPSLMHYAHMSTQTVAPHISSQFQTSLALMPYY